MVLSIFWIMNVVILVLYYFKDDLVILYCVWCIYNHTQP